MLWTLTSKLTDVVLLKDEKVETDLDRFKEGVEVITELVDAFRNLGSRDQDGTIVMKDWKLHARSIVRSYMGRTRSAFEDEGEWLKLKELLNELR